MMINIMYTTRYTEWDIWMANVYEIWVLFLWGGPKKIPFLVNCSHVCFESITFQRLSSWLISMNWREEARLNFLVTLTPSTPFSISPPLSISLSLSLFLSVSLSPEWMEKSQNSSIRKSQRFMNRWTIDCSWRHWLAHPTKQQTDRSKQTTNIKMGNPYLK